MKILLWIDTEKNQKALANKLHSVFPISGIILEARKPKRKITIGKIIEKVIEKLFLGTVAGSWVGLNKDYQLKYPSYPSVPTITVENINSDEAYEFSKQIDPDLILVSGTRLVKKKLLSLNPSLGILNLHTGLSPYIKGGPNCTNWCIATKQFHLIGNTVMWIDAGIDTGNIFSTAFTEFTGKENLHEIHYKVMEHAHDLYIKSVVALSKGKRINVPQDTIAKGITYYTKDFRLLQKINLVRNMKKFRQAVSSGQLKKMQQDIITVETGIE